MTLGASSEYDKFDDFDGSQKQKEFLLKEEALKCCVKDGVYSTLIKSNSCAKIATRADYIGMRPGDNIYFFFNRCIYGIGEILGIDNVCAFSNPKDNALYEFNDNEVHPYLCLFKAAPHFFKDGVDMDDVLMSNPATFRKLRFFHQRSFIQLDDAENLALKTFIIQKHEQDLGDYDYHNHHDASNQENTYEQIKEKFQKEPSNYTLNAAEIFKQGAKTKSSPNKIKSETYVEGLILDYTKRANGLLGYWDFIARQYPASPAKPSEYVDYMDLFGYRYVKGYKQDRIISKYVIIEIKSDEINEDAVLQVMKYVDWVCREFAHNDYSMIEAYVVGYSLKPGALDDKTLYTRNYIKSSKHNANRGIDVETGCWQEVKYISYEDILNDM